MWLPAGLKNGLIESVLLGATIPDFSGPSSGSVAPSTLFPRHRPLVLWHGLGDNYNSSGMKRATEIFNQVHPDIYIHSVSIDADPKTDENKSLFGDANIEVQIACDQLSGIPELSEGFDAVGFSQGGLLLRALVERCLAVKVHNLVTFGSPHAGVMQMPMCGDKEWFCKRRNHFLEAHVWDERIQKSVIPAQYFRDPYEYDKYIAYSHFLADVNNEQYTFSEPYRRNLALLHKLVLVSFLQDATVVPKESAHFEEEDPLTGKIVPFNETRLFKEDLIGLQSLYLDKKVDFLSIDDVHMRIPETFLVNVAQDYLGGKI